MTVKLIIIIVVVIIVATLVATASFRMAELIDVHLFYFDHSCI